MNDTCVIITTFLRDDCLFKCVQSIRKYYPDIAIFVGDNGKHTDAKRDFCKANNCVYLELPFDLGVSGVRNETFKCIPKQYKYIYICEDDIIFDATTDVSKLRHVLENEPIIGIAGSLLKRDAKHDQHYEATIGIENETYYIRRIANPEWKTTDGIRYFLCDLVLNVFLMRRQVWEDCPWDEQFKTALEHSDFFLSLKTKTSWKVAYIPDVWAWHISPKSEEVYTQYRRRRAGWKFFADKWKVKLSYSDFNSKPAIPLHLYALGVGYDTKDRNLEYAIRILEHYGCKWWLEAGTCLGAVRHNNFIGWESDIDIGIDGKYADLWDTFIQEFTDSGFELYKGWTYQKHKIELSFTRDGIKVDLFFFYEKDGFLWHGAFGANEKGQWGKHVIFLPHVFSKYLFDDLREIFFSSNRCFIPNPPERYLIERYGAGWNIPNKDYQYWTDCRAIDKNFFKQNKKVFIGGVWDLFHVGHLNILEQASMLGNLTIGVLTDEAAETYTTQPVIPFEQRKRIIESLKLATHIIRQTDRDPTHDLKMIGLVPDYIVHGDNWSQCPGETYVREYGGKAVFFCYTDNVSSSDIRQKIQSVQMLSTGKTVNSDEKIAIGIKTFFREETLRKTIKAIEQNFPLPYKLYIADDSRISDEKALLYQKLEKAGHVVIRLPFNSGLSLGRNQIIKAATERYVLIIDDDIEIKDGKSILNMLKVLSGDETLGLVSGMLTLENGNWLACENYVKGLRFEYDANVLFRYPAKKEIYEIENIPYRYVDQAVNFFLAKRELFDEVRWDDRIKIEYEHIDFFLTMKKTRWRAAVCFDAKAVHQNSDPGMEYIQYRRTAPAVYFLQKHNLSTVINRF